MRTPSGTGNGCPNFKERDSTKFKRPKDGWVEADIYARCSSTEPMIPVYDRWRYNRTGYLNPDQTELCVEKTVQEKSGMRIIFVSFARHMLVSGYVNE